MAHIEANNPNLSVEFHDREENVPAVVRSETSQDSVDLAQLVQSLINGEAFKSVMGHESLDAEYAPDDEASDAAQFARESAEKAYALHLERQQSAVTAPEVNSAQTPDVSQTGETGITLPEGYTYAPTYSKLSFSAARNLRSTPSIDGARKTTLQSGELNAIEVVSAETDEYRWFYIPPVPGVEDGAFMGVQKVANPGVEIQSTNESVTPSAAATPPTTPEQTVIPPQAGTNEPPVLEVTSTPAGPELPEGPALPPVGAELEGTPEMVDIESVEGYSFPDLARDVLSVYPVVWPDGTRTQVIVKGNRDDFRENNWPIYAPAPGQEEAATQGVQEMVSLMMEGVPSSGVVMHGVDKAPYRKNLLNESAKSVFVPEEFTTTFDFSTKPLVIVWVSDDKDISGLYFDAVMAEDHSLPVASYLIEPNDESAHNVIYVYSASQKKDNSDLRYVTTILGVPFSVIQWNAEMANNPNVDIFEALKDGNSPWTQIPKNFPIVAERSVPSLSATLAPSL